MPVPHALLRLTPAFGFHTASPVVPVLISVFLRFLGLFLLSNLLLLLFVVVVYYNGSNAVHQHTVRSEHGTILQGRHQGANGRRFGVATEQGHPDTLIGGERGRIHRRGRTLYLLVLILLFILFLHVPLLVIRCPNHLVLRTVTC